MAAYAAFTFVAARWGNLDGESPGRYWWALLPVLPSIAMVIALVRHLRRIDEYQRHLQLFGLAAGFGVAMIASVTFGWLAVAGLSVPQSHWIVFGLAMTSWAAATGMASRS